MKRKFKKIAIVFLIVFIAIQFYQPKQNKGYTIDIGENFANNYKVPPSVLNSLQKACYDCHSNDTKYLWYDYIQPARMFVESHIKNGKKELNFNEFASYSNRKQQSKLEAISKEVKSGDMPLSSYTLLHHDAKLTKEEKEAIIVWIDKTLNSTN
ncbi:heme-binding domain-containing protein [Flavobacterium buctense]|uniref:heme-binding domain-containing protein n=1 Tax=Flavobacterium buctense TaxID=1648146 RepID=UPI003622D9AD